MRGSEVFMALPWIYPLFAVRAFLPLHLGAQQSFFLLVAVIGLTGWARPARLVRGVVLSAKHRDYVLAARGFGASNFYLLRRHILPETFGVVLTQAAVLIPQYILAEVTLSFLGLGVSEPAPSWGNMLADMQKLYVSESYWWMFAAGLESPCKLALLVPEAPWSAAARRRLPCEARLERTLDELKLSFRRPPGVSTFSGHAGGLNPRCPNSSWLVIR
jgi:ABC-type microcin C transport system permease subunit YejE